MCRTAVTRIELQESIKALPTNSIHVHNNSSLSTHLIQIIISGQSPSLVVGGSQLAVCPWNQRLAIIVHLVPIVVDPASTDEARFARNNISTRVLIIEHSERESFIVVHFPIERLLLR